MITKQFKGRLINLLKERLGDQVVDCYLDGDNYFVVRINDIVMRTEHKRALNHTSQLLAYKIVKDYMRIINNKRTYMFEKGRA